MTVNLKKRSLFSVYLLGFLFALYWALPTYINSSFLNVFISERQVGLVYMVAAIFTILCFLILPFILRRFGNYKTSLFLVVLEMVALLGLVFLRSPFYLVFLFIINLVTIPLVYFLIDIFLEGLSINNQTGKVRGFHLTVVNLAWAISPLISGLLLKEGIYQKIYLAAFISLVPFVLILILNLKHFKDSKYEATHFWQTARVISKNKVMSNFLLQLFYAWMVIYTPIYLHTNLGLDWGSIGLIFGIMLLPFVIIQFPAGKLADLRFGEKEMLSIGFIVMALSTLLIFFVTGKSIFVWSLVLFCGRTGAAMVEVMCDVYFFKKVGNQNANLISFYRMINPLSYVVGLFLATILLSISGFETVDLFLILGLMMFFGLYYSLSIKDTK